MIRYTYSGGWDGIAVYGVDGNYFYSEAIDLSVGDEVTGSIVYTASQWYITLNDCDTLDNTTIYTDDVSIGQNALIYCDLEAPDGVSTNSQMPGDTTFSSIEVKDAYYQTIDISWVGYVNSGWSANLPGLGVYAPSDYTVYLYTNN